MATPTIRSKLLRYVTALSLGLVTALLAGLALRWQYAPLLGWDVFALTIVGTLLWDLHGHSDRDMAALAKRDDMSHSAVDVIVSLASVMSIISVFVLLSGESDDATPLLWHVCLGLATIVSSWLLLHTLYTLRYVILYYRGPRAGGIEFSGTSHPQFSDFAYYAYTIGMTYQVSDTIVTDSEIRAVTLRHAILSYIFGTAIIAASINMIVSLGS